MKKSSFPTLSFELTEITLEGSYESANVFLYNRIMICSVKPFVVNDVTVNLDLKKPMSRAWLCKLSSSFDPS